MPTATPSGNTETGESIKSFRALMVVAIVISLSLAVLLLRFYRLSELPPGIQNDEAANGVDALRVLQGEHAIFFPDRATGHEAVGVYAIALTTALLGPTLLAFHLPMAVASAGTVFAVFWLGTLLFGRDEASGLSTPWRGLLVGGVGAGLTAVSLSQTFLSRAGLRGNFLPLVLTLSLALLWWAWTGRDHRRGGWWQIAIAGAAAGLIPHTYLAARFVPLLFLLFGLSFVISLQAFGKPNARDLLLKQHLPRVGVFAGMAGLVASPLILYFVLHPQDLTIRSGQLWLLHEGQANPLGAFLKNTWEHILVLGFRGDQHHRYNFAGRPMLNPWQAIFFWLGVGLAAYRWRRSPASRLLLLWLLVLVLPATLADTRGEGPNTLRMIGATPAIYLLTASGIWGAFQFLWSRRLSLALRQRPVFLGHETALASFGSAICICLILAQGIATYRAFFEQRAGTPEFDRAYHAEWAEAADVLNAQQIEKNVVHIIPYPRHNEHFNNVHYGFEYLYQGTAPAHILAAITPHNLAQKVERALSTEESFSSVSFLDWNNEVVGGDSRSEDHVLTLLGMYGRHSNSETYQSFQMHTFEDVSLEGPWTLYSRLEPPTIHFDKGISLLGFALGQADEQVSTTGNAHLDSDRPLWVALLWQTAPDMTIDYSVSLRLHNTEGETVLQQDFVLSNAESAPTSRWTAGEPVDTSFYLEMPPDLPSSEYELRLVVYNFETWEPTVELGVWKPESVLTRLQIAASN